MNEIVIFFQNCPLVFSMPIFHYSKHFWNYFDEAAPFVPLMSSFSYDFNLKMNLQFLKKQESLPKLGDGSGKYRKDNLFAQFYFVKNVSRLEPDPPPPPPPKLLLYYLTCSAVNMSSFYFKFVLKENYILVNKNIYKVRQKPTNECHIVRWVVWILTSLGWMKCSLITL